MDPVLAYFDVSNGGVSVPETFSSPLARQIADALRIRTNTIAGRPNFGNLALEFIHQGRALPASVLRDYVLRTLQAFVPGIFFQVVADDDIDEDGFQRFLVEYRTP